MIKNGQNMQSEGSGMSLTEKYEGGDMSLICKPSAWRIQSKWLCQLKKKKSKAHQYSTGRQALH